MLVCRSTFDSTAEKECFAGIVDWMNGAPISAAYPHAKIDSWFYWAYNPDSGGCVAMSTSAACATSSPSCMLLHWHMLQDLSSMKRWIAMNETRRALAVHNVQRL